MVKTDLQRLRRMLDNCREIGDFVADVEGSYNKFVVNPMAQRAIALDIMQIGELAGKLSENCRNEMQDAVPWKEIRATRNVIAHGYDTVVPERLWDTATADISNLEIALRRVLREHDATAE